MSVETAYQFLFLTALIILGILMGIVLIRSIIGPRVTDRILCINMIGTLVICSVAILSRLLHEGYLIDIALIYAMISFLTVLVLASVYIRKGSGPARGPEGDVLRSGPEMEAGVSCASGDRLMAADPADRIKEDADE